MPVRSLKPGPFLMPMPVALVGANVGGKPNFMTAAFMGIVNYSPVVVACGLNPRHHTCAGILENRTFSLNIPSQEHLLVTDWIGLHSGAHEDKSHVFETWYGSLATAPLIKGFPLCAELRVLQTIPFSVDTLFLGEVVSLHVDESILTDDKPDWAKIDPLLFTFPDAGYRSLGERLATGWKAGKDFHP